MARSFFFLVIFLATVIGKRSPLPKDPLEPNFIPSSHERVLSHRPKHEDVSIEDGSKLAHYGLSGRRRLIPTSIKYNGTADYERVHDPKTDTRYHPKIWVPPSMNETEGNDTDIAMPDTVDNSASFVPPISSPRLPNPSLPQGLGQIPLLSPVPLPRLGLPPQPRPQWAPGQNFAPLPPYSPQSYGSRHGILPQQPPPQWSQNIAPMPLYRPQNQVNQFPPNYRNPAPSFPAPQQSQSWPQQQATVPQQAAPQRVQYWPQPAPQPAPQPNYSERPVQYIWPNNGK